MEQSLIGNIIAFVLQNFMPILFILALICAAVDRRGSMAERLLSWLLLLPIGLGGLWAGFYHIAYPDFAAKFIGWQESPFQFEVGMADLAFGVAGCVAFRASYGFKAATVLYTAILLMGDAVGHVRQMMVAGNFAPGNAGPLFYLDIILPVTTTALLLISGRDREPSKS